MDFAKKIMMKCGWKEGDGLGKNRDGIVKPLKSSMKFDSSGLGCDKAKEFNNHWWERVFNEASKNVEVNKVDGKVALYVKDEDSVEITTKEYSTKKLKKLRAQEAYGNFLKHSTLTNTGDTEEIDGRINDEDIKIQTTTVQLTDEELFKACGGRTAHKGARHGHTMSSKINRLEAQEQVLLEKMLKSKRDLEEKDRNGFINKKQIVPKDELNSKEDSKAKVSKKRKENPEDNCDAKPKKPKTNQEEVKVKDEGNKAEDIHPKSNHAKEANQNEEGNVEDTKCTKKSQKSKKSKHSKAKKRKQNAKYNFN